MEIFKYEEAKNSQKLGSMSRSFMVSKGSFTVKKAMVFISACSMSYSVNDSVYILLGFTILILAC